MPAKLLSDPKNRVLVLDFVDKNHGQSLKPVLSLVVLSVVLSFGLICNKSKDVSEAVLHVVFEV